MVKRIEIDGGAPSAAAAATRGRGRSRRPVADPRPAPGSLARADSGDAAALNTTIRFVEPLGSDTLVFFKLGGAEVIARLPPSPDLHEGRAIALTMDPARMHLFDAETETRIDARA